MFLAPPGWSFAFTPLAATPIRQRANVIRQFYLDTEIVQDMLDVTAGFAGGSIGVMGTLTAFEIKKQEMKKRSQCPYCQSSPGRITCAQCLGTGSLAVTEERAGEVHTRTCACDKCRGSGFVTCINCKGDGRAVPLMLNTFQSRDPESEMEDLGMQ
eukprot:FR737563.1.p1 GENE.FR737563.1~~FR737563.1.p1  ORF type:complete len:156 (-),score=13.72 FR737563.1:136-603(-)